MSDETRTKKLYRLTWGAITDYVRASSPNSAVRKWIKNIKEERGDGNKSSVLTGGEADLIINIEDNYID